MVPEIHGEICDKIENSTKTRFRIVLPRGWLKTTLITIAYPLWEAVRDPNIRILIAQNTMTNATKKLMAITQQVESNKLLRALFPYMIKDPKRWSTEAASLKMMEGGRTKAHPEATFEAAGTRTRITGRHYDRVIEDDTVAPDLDDNSKEVVIPSKRDIEQAIGWHRLVTPILINPMESINIIVGTRWAELDLISWSMANEPQFEHVERSCLEDEDGKSAEDGKITWPKRFGREVLDGLLHSMGPYLFSCLYLNKPIRAEDMIFKPEWVQFYETEPRGLITYTTVDPAGDPEDTKGDPDWNVVMTVGIDQKTGKKYILDMFREKCSPSSLLDALFHQVLKWKPRKVGLETIAYQKSLQHWIRERQRQEGVFFTVEGITHSNRSKNARIMGLQPAFSSGLVFMRSWMSKISEELIAFPYGENDDTIDALSMQINFWAFTDVAPELVVPQKNPDWMLFDTALEEFQNRSRESEAGGLFTELMEVVGFKPERSRNAVSEDDFNISFDPGYRNPRGM